MPIRKQHSRARRWLAAWVALALVAAMTVIPASAVSAAEPTDMVLEWNINAQITIGNSPTPPITTPPTAPGLGQVPPISVIHLAMVHTAMYDAVNAIDGTHEPYLDGLGAPSTASRAAAAAAAARGVLLGLVPAALPQVTASINAMYAASLLRIPDGTAETQGIAVGAAAAAAMLADRVGDGRTGTRSFPVGTEPGEWRLVPPANANAFSWVGDVRPFALKSSSQLRTEGPPDLGSAQYTAEFNEAKTLGAQVGDTRSEAQDLLATFAVANPVPIVNRAFRELATEHGLSTSEQARLFAMSNMAAADALIACWNNKNEFLFWRPQTAIQNGDDDGNPATDGDPAWMSLFPTPGYPDTPSGYNCFAAGMMYSARAFFGTDKVDFVLTGPSTRPYSRFTHFVRDAIEGRILIGFHFRHADEQGAWIGRKAAQWVDKHYFAPLKVKSH